jgi:hypothetical protein
MDEILQKISKPSWTEGNRPVISAGMAHVVQKNPKEFWDASETRWCLKASLLSRGSRQELLHSSSSCRMLAQARPSSSSSAHLLTANQWTSHRAPCSFACSCLSFSSSSFLFSDVASPSSLFWSPGFFMFGLLIASMCESQWPESLHEWLQ